MWHCIWTVTVRKTLVMGYGMVRGGSIIDRVNISGMTNGSLCWLI
jgi:hypothetical protein